MPILLRVTHADHEFRHDAEGDEVVIGRPKAGLALDLELPFDPSVSRPHARVFVENGDTMVEDMGSRWGTLLNDVEIRGKGPQPFRPGDRLTIGETLLRLQGAARPSDEQRQQRRAAATQTPVPRSSPVVTQTMSAQGSALPPSADRQRLQMLYDLPIQLAGELDEHGLLQTIVEKLVAVLPNVTRAGLLLPASDGKSLLLEAHIAPGGANISETLARRAIETGEAFIWQADDNEDIISSMVRQKISSGMYAPLVFDGKALGALCADDPTSPATYREQDLQLMVAVARYAAMALANLRLRAEVKQEATAKANLARQFSPPVVEWMLKQKGKMRLGGSRMEVTILATDVRGFTRQSAEMEPDDVVDLLNAYFGVMVPLVHDFGGVVDKFIGDAILAIWGFPPPAEDQQMNAVRAAIAMREAIETVSAQRRAADQPTCNIGIALHTGEALQGFIGSSERQEFTVIGDPVNMASRLCDGAAGGEVLISQQVHARVWKGCTVEPHTIPTKHEGDLRCYRVVGVV